MASRIPTKQLPPLLLICWVVVLALAVAEAIRNPKDPLIPGMLTVAFVGLLFHSALLLRKDR